MNLNIARSTTQHFTNGNVKEHVCVKGIFWLDILCPERYVSDERSMPRLGFHGLAG